MKSLLRNRISWIAIIIAVVFTSYMILVYRSFNIAVVTTSFNDSDPETIEFPEYGYTRTNATDTAFGGLFATYYISDSLSYHQYKIIRDSLDKIKQYHERENKSMAEQSRSWGFIGTAEMTKPAENEEELNNQMVDSSFKKFVDSVNIISMQMTKQKISNEMINKTIDSFTKKYNLRRNTELNRPKKNQLYFLTISEYILTPTTKFYVANSGYHLAYVRWEKKPMPGGGIKKVGRYVSKPVKIRYAADDKKILIPISKTQYKVLTALLNVLPIVSGFVLIYFIVGLPIQILINISKGKAFIKKNIYYLRLMTLVCLAVLIIRIFAPAVLRLYYSNMIPEDFSVAPLTKEIVDNLILFFVTLIFFFSSKAFQKGYQLQKEQDLTI